jgi:hypothetical protein
MVSVVLIAGISLFLACGASALIGSGRAADQAHPSAPTIIRIGIFH